MGKTVQVIPHVTDAIQDWIERVSCVPIDNSGLAPDVCIIEVSRFLASYTSEVDDEVRIAWRNCWRY